MSEPFKSYAVMAAVRKSLLTPDQRHVLCHMAMHAGPEGLCWSSIQTLMDDTGLSERTVQRAVKGLVDFGVLVQVRSPEHRTRTYRFNLAAVPMGVTLTGCQPDTGVTQTGEGVSLTGEGVTQTPVGVSVTPNPSQSRPVSVPEPERALDPPTEVDVTPPWARGWKGNPAVAVADAVVRMLSAIRQAQVSAKRCHGDARLAADLWRSQGMPPIGDLADETELVARWARDADTAENDIRGVDPKGVRWTADRSREVKTLLNAEKFSDRLDKARRWEAGTDPKRFARGDHPGADGPSDEQRAAIYAQADENGEIPF